MEEEKRLPRNIRQIGEKEEGVRVYLEDYVYTFIRKMDTGMENRAGILLGSREEVEGKRCFFIKGAVELAGLITDAGVCFSEGTWKEVEEEIGKYFSDCSICGWYIRGSEENCLDKEMLKRVHSQVFAGENCLMYWKEEEHDCFWLEEGQCLQRLRGYYVYYERNFQMQNYMLSCKERPFSEVVEDEAAKNFRKIMKERQHERKSEPGIWTQAGTVAAAAIIFVGSLYLIGRAAVKPKEENQVPAFAVGASVEMESGEMMTDNTSEEENRSTMDEADSDSFPGVELPTLYLHMNEAQAGDGQADQVNAQQSGSARANQSSSNQSSGSAQGGQSGTNPSSGSGSGNQQASNQQSGSGVGNQSGTNQQSGSGAGNQSGTNLQSGSGAGNQSGTDQQSGSGAGNQSGTNQSSGSAQGGQSEANPSSGSGSGDQQASNQQSGSGVGNQSGANQTSGAGTAGQSGTNSSSGSGAGNQAASNQQSGSGAGNQATSNQQSGSDAVSSDGSVSAETDPDSALDALEAGAPVSGKRYVIQPGDTMADLSIRFYGSTSMIMKICELNAIGNPNTIFIGQEIELP